MLVPRTKRILGLPESADKRRSIAIPFKPVPVLWNGGRLNEKKLIQIVSLFLVHLPQKDKL